MKVILVHGIYEREGDTNMGALLPHLRRHLPGTEVNLFSYGFMSFFAARWRNKREAKRLAAAIKDGDVIITHSNGAVVAYLAVLEYGAKPSGIVHVNPALDRWRSADVEWTEVIHSDGDRIVWLSQWIPFHLFGDQGKVGYRGTSDRVINHNASRFNGVMAYQGHCDLFAGIRIKEWAAFIAGRIDQRIDEADYWAHEHERLTALFGSYRAHEHERLTALFGSVKPIGGAA